VPLWWRRPCHVAFSEIRGPEGYSAGDRGSANERMGNAASAGRTSGSRGCSAGKPAIIP
jgi:hypothetical protein